MRFGAGTKLGEFRRWFAWYPVRMNGEADQRWCWLEVIERRRYHNPIGFFDHKEYRNVRPHTEAA